MKELNEKEAVYLYILAKRQVMINKIEQARIIYIDNCPKNIEKTNWIKQFRDPFRREKLNLSHLNKDFNKEALNKMDNFFEELFNEGLTDEVKAILKDIKNTNVLNKEIQTYGVVDFSVHTEFEILKNKVNFNISNSDVTKEFIKMCKMFDYSYKNISLSNLDSKVQDFLKKYDITYRYAEISESDSLEKAEFSKIFEDTSEYLASINARKVVQNSVLSYKQKCNNSFESVKRFINNDFLNFNPNVSGNINAALSDYYRKTLHSLAACCDVHNSRSKPTFFGWLFNTKYYRNYNAEKQLINEKKEELVNKGFIRNTVELFSNGKYIDVLPNLDVVAFDETKINSLLGIEDETKKDNQVEEVRSLNEEETKDILEEKAPEYPNRLEKFTKENDLDKSNLIFEEDEEEIENNNPQEEIVEEVPHN